jgi:acetylglutamate kinase
MQRLFIVKVGGNELDDPEFLDGLCRAVADASDQLVLVHGGGKEISAAMEQAGEPVRFADGLRVTTPAAMAIMQQVVCGTINKRVVAGLNRVGVAALGLSGIDLELLRCRPHRPDGVDLGRVGAIEHVAVEPIRHMLDLGWLPVFAPVAVGRADHLSYNVNADQVAASLAAALRADELIFVSNVPGVLVDGAVAPRLDVAAVEQAIADGVISGGMIPKVRAALAALETGAVAARITNLDGFAGGGGTRIV